MSIETYTFVDTKESLQIMCDELSNEDVLGIDLECENNLHHYGTYISIIQISSRTKQWVVDFIALDNLGPLRRIFTDRSIQKIFHDVSFDLRILNFQFSCKPKNIYDTQVAALLVGKTEIGLGSLLLDYFDVKKESKFQMADWTKRPLTPGMLSYAVKDTTYLIRLRDILTKELKSLDRYEWLTEELELIENARYEKKPYTFKDFKGYSHFTDTQRSILKSLFSLREKYAKLVNMPIHFIIPNKKITELLINTPKTLSQWKSLKGVHPIVKKNSSDFFNAINAAKERKIALQILEHKRYSEEQKKLIAVISDLRDTQANALGIARHLVLNKDQLHDVVRTNSLKSLKAWQKNLLGPKIKPLIN